MSEFSNKLARRPKAQGWIIIYGFANPLTNRNLLKRMVSMGYEVEVKWLPRTPIHRHGKRLAEEVKGNIILVYAEDEEEVLELVRHGFAKWLLNQHTRKYRMLINKLIELAHARKRKTDRSHNKTNSQPNETIK